MDNGLSNSFDLYKKNYSSEIKASASFLKRLHLINPNLDAVFDRNIERWKIISWYGSRGFSVWREVMTVYENFDEKTYMPLGEKLFEQLREMKKLNEQRLVIQKIKEYEERQERQKDSEMDSVFHEMAKDMRKPLLNRHDGFFSNWKRFT